MAAFIRHTSCDKCGSSDGRAVYQDESSHCFVCEHTIPSEEFKEANQKKPSRVRSSIKKEVDMEVKPSTKPALTPEENAEIKSETSVKAKGFRSIDDSVYAKFGVRHAFAEDTGEVIEQYYPCTQDGQLVGYKVREVPKNFYSKGRTGADCELFMQFKFNRGGKYVIITEGEIDALSAYQMLSEYNNSKGRDYETAVVSPTTGANSHKQIAGQFRFFDSFENIIISYDNDKAGQTATEQLLKVLPKGKVKIMPMRYKDANEYLEKDKAKEFVNDFYEAKKQVPVGVLASSNLYDRIMGQTAVAKIPFPPMMQKLNELFVGGMPLGHIINIAADTGIGKTTLVNELIYYWIFNSPHTVGIVSMELDAGQYGEVLLSRHLEKKLALIESQDEKIAYLSTDRVIDKAKELTIKEDGDSRFYLLDNRDGTIEEIQDTVEELVSSCGAKVIVLDPLQDILDGLSNEEQANFMKWAKGFIKSHGITFVFINHMRKTPAGQSGADSEQNIMGSSTIIKSASANILLKRDKMAESELIRNSTEITVTKNRVCGLTGPAGFIYYDNATHTLHNLDDWLNNH
jgi:KaiC/GvpD/RAD55 family RecA-like ATPase